MGFLKSSLLTLTGIACDIIPFRSIHNPKLPELRVLLYHHIPQSYFQAFEMQLDMVGKTWEFITPQKFEKICLSEEKPTGRQVLLTFDDGYFSNYLAAKTILKQRSISAIFFVSTDFINQTCRQTSESFIRDRLKVAVDQKWTKRHHMSVEHLRELVSDKHLIGHHTKTHPRLCDLHTTKELDDELDASKEFLASELGISIEHFAFPFGDFESVNRHIIEELSKRFQFIHSGLRGNNLSVSKTKVVARDAIDVRENIYVINSYLNGLADPLYQSKLSQLSNWAPRLY